VCNYLAYKTRIESRKQSERFSYLLTKLDRNILKDVTKKEIEDLEQTARNRERQLSSLEKKIAIDVPREARRFFIEEQLAMTRDALIETFKRWQELQDKSMDVEEETPYLPGEISNTIEKQLKPEYLKRKGIEQLKSWIGALGSLTAVISIARNFIPSQFFYPMFFSLVVALVIALVKLGFSSIRKGSTEYRVFHLLVTLAFLIAGPAFLVIANNFYQESWGCISMAVGTFGFFGIFLALYGIILSKDFFSQRRYRLKSHSIEMLLRNGKLDEAASLIRTDFIDYPDDHRLRLLHAKLLLRKNKTDGAAKIMVREMQKQRTRITLLPFRKTNNLITWTYPSIYDNDSM
jgi:hypothetical protein